MAERQNGGYRQDQEHRERQGERGRFFGEEESRGQWRSSEDERDYGYGGQRRDWQRGGERWGGGQQGRFESFEHSPRGYGSERFGEERYGQSGRFGEQGRGRESYGRESYGREGYSGSGSGYGAQGYGEGYGREGYGRGEFGQRRYGNEWSGWQGGRAGSFGRQGFGGSEGWNERGLGSWQGPGSYGERSYGGYGEWPGPEYEGLESGRQGYGGIGSEFLEGRRRSGATEWGLGRSGSRLGWRDRLRGGSSPAGRFAGRGPKGYQRSDDRIREDICDALMADPEIDATFLAVIVSDGEVTLEGSVDDRQMKRDAEDLAEEVSGVKQVHNRLRVQQGGDAGSMQASGTSPEGSTSSGTGGSSSAAGQKRSS